MIKVIYLVTFVFFVLGILALYMAFVARRHAVAEQAKIGRVFDAARRALTLIHSEDPVDILNGLQTLSVYDIGSIRMKAFPRLMELSHHENKQVAELAKYVIQLCQPYEKAGQDEFVPTAVHHGNAITL